MTPERWQQVKDIFDRAIECGPASRLAYIGEHCGGDEELRREVESLLAADTETGSLLYAPVPETDKGEARRTDPRSLEGRRIGPYQMQREIGRGGMGVVYLASRADRAFQRLVAIKVVNISLGSAETIARFEQEREILASLDHPNIARLLDGGTTPDGLSYLVMEYVEGHAIDVYCDEHKLDIPARLQLFRTVCGAVEYAHQKHIIHRDIKPANILVTAEGAVKLLDFGIAKLMPGRDVESTLLVTRTGLRLMTPEYASPEQIRGEAVAAATDVYALGVVLYELLTGHLPYRLRSRIFHEIIRVVCEEPPTRPSTVLSEPKTKDTRASGDAEHITRVRRTSPADLQKCLSGDLDGIILKALEKQPYDRYRSASSLSDDIAQHLEGRPVVARQATVAYRAGKFVQRNLPWILLFVAFAAALSTGGITINWTGAEVIGGCLLAVGLWYASRNQVLGRKIAESESLFARSTTNRGYIVSMFMGVVGGLSATLPPLVALSFVLLLFAVLMRQVYGWLDRRNIAGGLLLDLSQARPYRLLVPSFVFQLALVALLRLSVQDCRIDTLVYLIQAALGRGHDFGRCALSLDLHGLYGFYYGVWVICNGLVIFLEQRCEIRARGIVVAGTLYSWERIESYEWYVGPFERSIHTKIQGPKLNQYLAQMTSMLESTCPPGVELSVWERQIDRQLQPGRRKADMIKSLSTSSSLRLRLRGGMQFLPPVQIPGTIGRRFEIDAIMSRYLSEWPGAETPEIDQQSAMTVKAPNVDVFQLDTASLEAITGQYDWRTPQCTAVMWVTTEGDGKVYIQLTGRHRMEIFPKSPTEFFFKGVDAQVTFVKDASGKVVKAIHQEGAMTIEAPRLGDFKVDAASLGAIAGHYDYDRFRPMIRFTVEDDKVYAQPSGHSRLEIFPKSPTEFFWKVLPAEVAFVKDASGNVVKAIHKQGGSIIDAPRMDEFKLDTASLDGIVGKYAYDDGKILTVTREGGQVFVQLTGQDKFEVHAKSAGKFFWGAASAELTFVEDESGKVTKLSHYYNRKTTEAPKMSQTSLSGKELVK